MRMRYFLFTIIATFLVALSLPSVAQKFEIKAVNFDSIRVETQNPSSKYFFPKLIKGFQSNDTTMTFDQYRHFYYGYVFQEDYNPFRESPFSDMIESLY